MKLEMLEPQAVDYAGMSLGQLMTCKREIDVRIKGINGELKEAKAEEDAIEAAIIAKLEEQGTDAATLKGIGTATIRQSVVPNVRDWDDFYAFIKANDYFHLLERRAAAAGCRELFEREGAIPGVEPFNKRTLGFTAA